jgi:hypothetical protein
MIQYATARSVQPDDVIFLPYPDWIWRRYNVRVVTHDRGLTYLTVFPTDGEDNLLSLDIVRGDMEVLHVIRDKFIVPDWEDELVCIRCGFKASNQRGLEIHKARVH